MKTINFKVFSLFVMFALLLAFTAPLAIQAKSNNSPSPVSGSVSGEGLADHNYPSMILVTGDHLVDLLCGDMSIVLKANGNSAYIPHMLPCDVKANILVDSKSSLPANLPVGSKFLDAVTVVVLHEGEALDALPSNKLMNLGFNAKDLMVNNLALLHWDGSSWVRLGLDGNEASTNLTGLFVLVTRGW